LKLALGTNQLFWADKIMSNKSMGTDNLRSIFASDMVNQLKTVKNITMIVCFAR
jgi:hypothetical protein